MSELLKVFEFAARQAKELAAGQSVTDAPIVIGDVTVIPVSKLSCGFACGGSDLAQKKKADGVMAGAGAKVKKTPLTFLAVCGKDIRLLQISEQAAKKGVLSALKPLVAKFKEKSAAKKTQAETDAAAT